MLPDQAANPIMQMFPFVLIFLIFYFLVIKPEKNKQKEKKKKIADLKKMTILSLPEAFTEPLSISNRQP